MIFIWILPSDIDNVFVKLNQNINKQWDGNAVYVY